MTSPEFIEALVKASRDFTDFPGWLALMLASAAAQVGGTEALLSSRPGSWEAGHVRALLIGTLGPNDEYLESLT